MKPPRIYLTTAIPYVNAAPHLGFALEAVQADALARHHRSRGARVRLLTGTDDNSLKNVLAADAAGMPVREFVDRNAAAFAALRGPLDLSYDDFIRTSRDPRHPPGVRWLWRACAAAGDLYQARYEGLYCVGCEHYLTDGDLDPLGRCPEHREPPARLAERNWFFRLSRYARPLREAIDGGRLRIAPEQRRREALAFIDGGLRDLSVSRSRGRARDWGIAVPGDPDQVVYVWWDALGNYLTSLDLGGDGAAYGRWWVGGDRRVHLIGKGVLLFHAVYWPAMLLSAGLPLPTDILVHDYLTVDGRKIGKSAGAAVDPVTLAGEVGTDALRWWLLREVARVADTDFTLARLVARADADLAGGVGNLVSRVVAMAHRYRDGLIGDAGPDAEAGAVAGPDAGAAGAVAGRDAGAPGRVAGPDAEAADLVAACRAVPGLVDRALAGGDFRRATGAVLSIVERANRYVERVRPWELARSGGTTADARLEAALEVLLAACRSLAAELAPFVPATARRVAAACTPVDGRLPDARPVFPRVGTAPAAGRAAPARR